MPETTIKQLQTDYARISAKVRQQEQALSPDVIGTASVPGLAAANGEILADVQELREKIETTIMTLSDGRQILKHEYEALRQLARENGVGEERLLARLTDATIEGGQIKGIDLNNLRLSTITPLEALSGLVELNLSENAIIGDPQFPSFPKLQKLELWGNEITGVSGLARLTALTELRLSRNAIQEDPQFPALSKLQVLDLCENKITGVSALSRLNSLTILGLGYNSIQGDPQFPDLPKLQTLILDGNQIAGVSGLSHLSELTDLWLNSNAIRGDLQFPDLPKLQKLALGRNKITGVSGLSPLTGLKTLYIDSDTKGRLERQLKKLEENGVTIEGADI